MEVPDVFGLARAAVAVARPEEPLELRRWAGQENVRGRLTPRWHAPRRVAGSVRSLGADELRLLEDQARVQVQRKVYLRADVFRDAADARRNRPADIGIGKTLLRRADGSWWLVTGALEDFSVCFGDALAPDAANATLSGRADDAEEESPAAAATEERSAPCDPLPPDRSGGWICLRITLQRTPPEGLEEESGACPPRCFSAHSRAARDIPPHASGIAGAWSACPDRRQGGSL